MTDMLLKELGPVCVSSTERRFLFSTSSPNPKPYRPSLQFLLCSRTLGWVTTTGIWNLDSEVCAFQPPGSAILILKLVIWSYTFKAHLAVNERVMCIRGFGTVTSENQGAINEVVIRVILIVLSFPLSYIWPWPQLLLMLTLRYA